MPFKSKAQQRKMWATDPTLAQEMSEKMTPGQMKALPKYVSKRNQKRTLPQFKRKK